MVNVPLWFVIVTSVAVGWLGGAITVIVFIASIAANVPGKESDPARDA